MKSVVPFIFISVIIFKYASGYLRVCYYTNWSQYRPNGGKFTPENVDPKLCSHIIFAFGKLQKNKLVAFEWNDDSTEFSLGMYAKINNLKQKNPQLKTLLAVGGWNAGSKPFSDMVATKASRKEFVNSTIHFLRKRKFDGLDMDWEYPAMRGGRPEDKQNLVALLGELYQAFEQDSYQTGQARLLLTAAVPAGKSNIDGGYDIPKIVRFLDFINIMTYDLHGSWEKHTGHNSPLYGRIGETVEEALLNMDWAVKYWTTQGAPKHKLIVGMGLYGRSFQLANVTNNGIGALAGGAGRAGKYTREAGFMSYYEVCEELKKGATRVWHMEHKAPYLINGDLWVGYDDEESIISKVQWVKQNGYGGVMVWSLALDDFSGTFCNKGPYPLLTTINTELGAVNAGISTHGQKITAPSTIISNPAPIKPSNALIQAANVPPVVPATINRIPIANAPKPEIRFQPSTPVSAPVEISPGILTNFPADISALLPIAPQNTPILPPIATMDAIMQGPVGVHGGSINHPGITASPGNTVLTPAINNPHPPPVVPAHVGHGVFSNNHGAIPDIVPKSIVPNFNQVNVSNALNILGSVSPQAVASSTNKVIANTLPAVVSAEVMSNNVNTKPVSITKTVSNTLPPGAGIHSNAITNNSLHDSFLMNISPDVLQRLLANLTQASPHYPIAVGIPHSGHFDNHPPVVLPADHSGGSQSPLIVPSIHVDVGARGQPLNIHNIAPTGHAASHQSTGGATIHSPPAITASSANIIPGSIAVVSQPAIAAAQPTTSQINTAPLIPVASADILGARIAGLNNFANINTGLTQQIQPKPKPTLQFSFSSSSSSNSNSSSSSSNSSSSSRNINIRSPKRELISSTDNLQDIIIGSPTEILTSNPNSVIAPGRAIPSGNSIVSRVGKNRNQAGRTIPSRTAGTVIPVTSINSLADILANFTDVPMAGSVLLPEQSDVLSPSDVMRELSLLHVLESRSQNRPIPNLGRRQRERQSILANRRLRNRQISQARARNAQRMRASTARQPANRRRRINQILRIPNINTTRRRNIINQPRLVRQGALIPVRRGQNTLSNLASTRRHSNSNPFIPRPFRRQGSTQLRPTVQNVRANTNNRLFIPNLNSAVQRNRQNRIAARRVVRPQRTNTNRTPRIMVVGNNITPQQSTTIRRRLTTNRRFIPNLI